MPLNWCNGPRYSRAPAGKHGNGLCCTDWDFMRELMALSATGNSPLRLRPDELATAQNMAKVLDFDRISRLVAVFNDNIFHIERNANPKILMLDTSISVNTIMKG
jgi:DNA polymerase-3 subunit delta'